MAFSHLPAQHRPHAVVEPVAGPGVQVDGVQHRTPDVVLPLPVRLVADPDRPRALVALQVRQFCLGQVAAAVDAVDDLQVAVPLGHVGDEVVEVRRLPVEVQRVQAPEGEGRVPDPAVAVVVVARAARGLRQRCGGRGGDRTGRRIAEPLEGQRAAGQVRLPRVVRDAPAGEPVLPVVRGPGQPLVRLLVGRRRLGVAPGQHAEPRVALLQQSPGHRTRTLETQPHVGGQRHRRVAVRGARHRLVISALGVLPGRATQPVPEGRLAFHQQLDLAVHAAHRADQHVRRGVVRRRPVVGRAARVARLPRAHHQGVPDDDPSLTDVPARLEDERAG